MKITILLAALPLLATSPSANLANEGTPDQEFIYKTVGDNPLKLHVFNPENHSRSDSRPAIIFFFGGGWNSGSPRQFFPHCEHLASRGMVAMSAEYRVRSRDGTTPAECVADGKSALRWVRHHAAELGVDPDKIAAGGGSAGGHVAAAVAACNGFDEEGEDDAISCRPDALVLFNPVFDNGPTGYGFARVENYWKEISPLHNIRKTAPPTAVFLGTSDRLVPVETAVEYKRLMESKGRRCDLHLYPGQPHGFFNFKNTENFNATVAEMDRFLVSLDFIPNGTKY